MGFAHLFVLKCSVCAWTNSTYSSKQCVREKQTQGRQIFEVNARAVISFRVLKSDVVIVQLDVVIVQLDVVIVQLDTRAVISFVQLDVVIVQYRIFQDA